MSPRENQYVFVSPIQEGRLQWWSPNPVSFGLPIDVAVIDLVQEPKWTLSSTENQDGLVKMTQTSTTNLGRLIHFSDGCDDARYLRFR